MARASCYDHDLERIQDILPLDRVGKEVNIIVQAPAALLQLEAAEEAGRDGIEYDSRQYDQGGKESEGRETAFPGSFVSCSVSPYTYSRVPIWLSHSS